jgi:flagellar hook-length control protein FliK
VWNPTGNSAKDDDKPGESTSTPTDAATAMLALLGQSIPATATPTSTATGGSAGGAAGASTVTAATLQATGMPGMPAMGVAPAQPDGDADDEVDGSNAIGDLKGGALSALADATDDDATPNTTALLGASAKLAEAAQGTVTAAKSDHSDPLDALRNLAAPFTQAQASAQSPAAVHVASMNSSVGTPAFAQELGQQVAWMGGQNIKEARITLHPEDMGQLDVKVSVSQNHVDVSFIAQHPNAVHAVQQTLSQLDSMLAHHGLTLGQAQVGQGHGGGAGQGTSPGSAAGGDGSATDEGDISSVVAPVVQALGLLDTFA